ncbi:hypothetical protein BDR03DRAFT_940815 [Suillus americanus]|nr:hypothetical protein BDR03DRAFT_940815 [Suillus americanus]
MRPPVHQTPLVRHFRCPCPFLVIEGALLAPTFLHGYHRRSPPKPAFPPPNSLHYPADNAVTEIFSIDVEDRTARILLATSSPGIPKHGPAPVPFLRCPHQRFSSTWH